MDFKSFSNESFDPVTWINKSFEQVPEDGNRESHASGLVYKLQLFLQEINSSLEDTAHQVIRSLPFVLKQAESLEDEVAVLNTGISQIQSEIGAVQDSDSLQRIRYLHQVMEKMKSGLESEKQREDESSPVPVIADSDCPSVESDSNAA